MRTYFYYVRLAVFASCFNVLFKFGSWERPPKGDPCKPLISIPPSKAWTKIWVAKTSFNKTNWTTKPTQNEYLLKGLIEGIITYVCMYVYTYVCIIHTYIRMYACMYVYTYVHTYYVLINPPIPYITSSPLCLLHKFRPKKFLLHEWGHIIYYILATVFASCFYVLFKFCFMREDAQGSPLVTSLKMSFLFILKQSLYIFASCSNFASRERAPKGPPL